MARPTKAKTLTEPLARTTMHSCRISNCSSLSMKKLTALRCWLSPPLQRTRRQPFFTYGGAAKHKNQKRQFVLKFTQNLLLKLFPKTLLTNTNKRFISADLVCNLAYNSRFQLGEGTEEGRQPSEERGPHKSSTSIYIKQRKN